MRSYYKIHGYCLGTHESNPKKYECDLKILSGRAVWIRGYGQPEWKAHRMAKMLGFKTAVGAWLGRNEKENRKEIHSLIEESQKGFVDLAIVGSEALLRKELSDCELASYVRKFKASVPEIPVTVCDDINNLLRSPEVLASVDIVGAHIYPYWNGIRIDESLPWLIEKYRALQKITKKEIIIAETGWPGGGNTVGDAVPNEKNALRYFKEFIEWADSHMIRYFYFAPFCESWKIPFEGPQGAHWGRWYEDRTPKPWTF